MRINRRYFSSKILSRSVQCLHAEIWYKRFIIFNLFYLCFSFGPDACTVNFSFKICGVVPCVIFRNNNLASHTHTWYCLKTSLTTFFFTPLAVHTWYFSCVAVTNLVLTNLCWVLFQSSNHSKKIYYFSCIIRSTIYRPAVYFHISNSDESGACQRGFQISA